MRVSDKKLAMLAKDLIPCTEAEIGDLLDDLLDARAELAACEAKLAEMEQRYETSHTCRLQAEDALAYVEAKLAEANVALVWCWHQEGKVLDFGNAPRCVCDTVDAAREFTEKEGK